MSIAEPTAQRADAFIRRQALWSRLLDLFKHHRPDEATLAQVSLLAEVAIDQVFSAYRLTEAQQLERHGAVKDFAECASLYGYVLGYHQARQELAQARQDLAVQVALPPSPAPLPAELAAQAAWGALRALADASLVESVGVADDGAPLVRAGGGPVSRLVVATRPV